MDELMENAKNKMQKSLDLLQSNLSKIRTGRAHAGILDHITVDYYGSETQLNQIANINVADATTINVQPYEKSMVAIIEKTIRSSDLGLNPAATGDVIRVPMPALTEERRRDLIKLVKSEGENAKIAIRNIRRDCNESLKRMTKNKEISEDEERKSQEEIQRITDQFILDIDKIILTKEKDLLTV
ncbi:MAG: ribosome recycling factor [Methylophilaceae bacterium]